jgi:hypothetical protein
MQRLADAGATGVMLCHGIITSDNGTLAHAWVEGIER